MYIIINHHVPIIIFNLEKIQKNIDKKNSYSMVSI